MKILINQVKTQAKEAVLCSQKHIGRTKKHKINAYGIALKYIFALRDLSLKNASEIAGISPQNLNYIVNRQPVEQFDPVYVRRICQKFNVDCEYFVELVEQIGIILEGKC